MSLKLAFRHCRAQLRETVRAPGIIVPAMLTPPLFYLFFGAPEANNGFEANLVLASYATYAFMGVIFSLFTGGIAQGRVETWDEYLRTLPASYLHRMLGWALACLIVGVLPFLLVAILALIVTEADAGLPQWMFLSVAVLYGSVAIALLAMAFGYWFSPKVAVPVATLSYFSLTYAGGIWTSPQSLPAWLQKISPFLPTRLWAELAWSSIEAQPWHTQHWLGLAGYMALFGFLAVWGYRRETRWRFA